jgi:hypothetical protein
MQTKAEFLRAQMQASSPGRIESVRSQCARAQELTLVPYLSKAKEDLQGSPSASALLKDWYSSWLAIIENLPLDGSEVDTTALDERMKRVVVEATW